MLTAVVGIGQMKVQLLKHDCAVHADRLGQ